MAVTIGSTSARSSNRPDASGNVYIQNLQQEAGGLAWDSYNNGTEVFIINDGVNLIVDPASVGWRDMTKGPSQIVINYGKLLIRNTSTTVGLRFLKARSSTTVTNTYILPYGLGVVDVQGNWIELGTSTGAANQTFTHWCTDFLPAIEVETSPGSGVYEWWYNLGYMPELGLIDGNTGGLLGFAGKRCLPAHLKCFEQESMGATEWISSMTAAQQWKSTIRFFDGVNGAIPPAGCKLRVPNIVLADCTQAQYVIASEYDNCCRIDTSNGGSVLMDKAIMSSAYLYAIQARKIDIKNVAMSIIPIFSESYDITVNNLFYFNNPQTLYGTNPKVPSIVSPADLTSRLWNLIHGARFTKLTCARANLEASTSTGATAGVVYVSTSKDISFDGVTVLLSNNTCTTTFTYQSALRFLTCSDVSIKNLHVEGLNAIHAITSTNITVDGVEWAPTVHRYFRNTSTDPFGSKYRLPDGSVMTLGVPYWFKIRGHHDLLFGAIDHEYVDGPPVSFTRPLVTYSQGANAPTCKSTKMSTISVVPTGTARQLMISWGLTFNSFFNQYRIQYSTDPNFTWGDGTAVDVGNFAGYNTYSTTSCIHTMPADGVVYYFKIRRYEDAGLLRWVEYGTFAGIAGTFITDVTQQAKNYCLQSNSFDNASWVFYAGGAAKSVATGAECGPGSWAQAVANRSADAVTLATNVNESGLTQTVAGLVSGTSYVASVWLRTTQAVPVVTGKIRFGTSVQDITISLEWKKFSITNADAATSRAFSFTVDAAIVSTGSVVLRAAQAVVTETTRPNVHVVTTTIASPSVLPYACWNRSGSAACGARMGGSGVSQLLEEIGGIDIDFEAIPAGMLVATLHVGTVPTFTPDYSNMFGLLGGAGYLVQNGLLVRCESSVMEVKNVTKLGHFTLPQSLLWVGGAPGQLTCTGMSFDFDGGLGGNNAQGPIDSSGPVSVILKDCDFGNINTRQGSTFGFLVGNNAGGPIVLQNIRCNQSNISWIPYQQGILFKGVSGAGGKRATFENQTAFFQGISDTSEAWSTGSTYQTASYDTHFCEMYHGLFSTPKTGSLDILMTASTLGTPPYVITGDAQFDGRGGLYFFEVGASVTWTWPHKILGVSGFQALSYQIDGSNFFYDGYWLGCTSWKALTSPNGGLASDLSFIVNCEYNISADGATWSGWKRATATNLSGESVSATAGFYLKIRLTAQPGLILGTPVPANITVGTVITGATTGASGTVSEFLRLNSNNGIVIFSAYTPGAGNAHFLLGETLTNGGGATLRYSMFPRSKAMYVNALRLHTTIDPDAKYPINTVPLTINNIVSGSRLIVKRVSDNVVLVNTQVDTTSYELFTEWVDTEVRVELRNASGTPAYKPWYAIGTITSNGLSVNALQERDDI